MGLLRSETFYEAVRLEVQGQLLDFSTVGFSSGRLAHLVEDTVGDALLNDMIQFPESPFIFSAVMLPSFGHFDFTAGHKFILQHFTKINGFSKEMMVTAWTSCEGFERINGILEKNYKMIRVAKSFLISVLFVFVGCARHHKYQPDIDRLNRQIESQRQKSEQMQKEIENENKKREELNNRLNQLDDRPTKE